MYAALYQLSERVELAPSRGGLPWSAGLRGVFDCATYDAGQKLERGHCPFVEGATDGTDPIIIDTTGTEHDEIRHCPRALQLREHHAQRDLSLYHQIEKLGGAQAYYPAPLSMRDTATLETYTLLKSIQGRFLAEVRRMRASMDRRPS